MALMSGAWDDNSLGKFDISGHELTFGAGVLLRDNEIVLPMSFRADLLHAAREGHLGIVRTKQGSGQKV